MVFNDDSCQSISNTQEEQSEEKLPLIQGEEKLTSPSVSTVEEEQGEEELPSIQRGSGQKENDMKNEVTVMNPRVARDKGEVTAVIPSTGINPKRSYHSEVDYHLQRQETLPRLP